MFRRPQRTRTDGKSCGLSQSVARSENDKSSTTILIPEEKIDLNFDRRFGGDFLVVTFIAMTFINDVAFVQT